MIEPEYLTSLDAMLDFQQVTKRQVANYMMWRRMYNVISDGPTAFVDALFTFNQVLTGVTAATPRYIFTT